MNVSIVTQTTGLLSLSERAKKEEEHLANKSLLKIPRRCIIFLLLRKQN